MLIEKNDKLRELEALKMAHNSLEGRRTTIKTIYRDFPVQGMRNPGTLRRPTLIELESLYSKCCKRLSVLYPEAVARTSHEAQFSASLYKQTNLRPMKSVWIGLMNVDFLFLGVCAPPASEGKRLKGLAIEIDGSVHDQFYKMAKDLYKVDRLFDLSIGLVSVRNWDLNYLSSILTGFSKISNLSTRERIRVKRRIWLETILFASTDSEFKSHFNPEIDILDITTLERASNYFNVAKSQIKHLMANECIPYYLVGPTMRAIGWRDVASILPTPGMPKYE